MAASEERIAVLGHDVPYRQTISPSHLKGTRNDQDTNNHDFQLDARGKSRMTILVDNQPNKALTVSIYGAHAINASIGDADTEQIGSSRTVILADKRIIQLDVAFPFYIIRCAYASAPTDATAKYYTVYVNLTTGAVGKEDEDIVETPFTGTGNVVVGTHKIAPGAAFKLDEIELHLSAAPTTGTQNLVITLDDGVAAAYDLVILTLDLVANAVTDLVIKPKKKCKSSDVITAAWTNTDGVTYGLKFKHHLL